LVAASFLGLCLVSGTSIFTALLVRFFDFFDVAGPLEEGGAYCDSSIATFSASSFRSNPFSFYLLMEIVIFGDLDGDLDFSLVFYSFFTGFSSWMFVVSAPRLATILVLGLPLFFGCCSFEECSSTDDWRSALTTLWVLFHVFISLYSEIFSIYI